MQIGVFLFDVKDPALQLFPDFGVMVKVFVMMASPSMLHDIKSSSRLP